MEKVIQRESFNYKDDAIRATKEQHNSEEITHLFIDSKNNNDKSHHAWHFHVYYLNQPW